ncbi:IS110 family transposase [Planomicrobium sp. MB-3u-38]|uniref:IS110 family transposase n=1 Tax=Planomicrobium sp. MB-3u-38 TaxID=2058318 RepID=UPI001E449407|nr:IS110 family transposase [Planomicrobium sp. MB-3u-38]
MVLSTFNHIQGSNGSHWNRLMRGENAQKICIVAIYAAKFVNAAMICNVYGDIHVKPFEFNASSPGFKRLMEEIDQAKEGYGFEEVVIGIETTGHYYEDLVRLCEEKEYHVRIINAATTSKERETVLNYTKTDNVDLMAITQSILHGRGWTSQKAIPLLEQLKTLSRAHRALINAHSQTVNHARLYMDHIFREFQGSVEEVDGKKVKLKIFSTFDSKASRYLMRHYPYPTDVLALGKEGLRWISIEQNLKMRDTSIERLIRFAHQSVSKPKNLLQAELLLWKIASLCQTRFSLITAIV